MKQTHLSRGKGAEVEAQRDQGELGSLHLDQHSVDQPPAPLHSFFFRLFFEGTCQISPGLAHIAAPTPPPFPSEEEKEEEAEEEEEPLLHLETL